MGNVLPFRPRLRCDSLLREENKLPSPGKLGQSRAVDGCQGSGHPSQHTPAVTSKCSIRTRLANHPHPRSGILPIIPGISKRK
ncbi:hypothetical protein AVEN_230174-1 [Araneus ventricosus]|uniref:Uncharacterized protein n=1 Tax=Araneus ventricosus TaxID=182803 RepID=A0A4Y2IR33_ARAVE|nr:hypothetical protein AVEN_230174-1 [Araneus ventricosus]